MSDAKPRAYGRVVLAAVAAVGVIASIFGVYNAAANQSASTPTQQVVGRAESCKLDASSTCVIKHGLGVKPTAVVVTPGGPGQNLTVDVSKITDTQYVVKALWHDGKPFTTKPTIKFNAVYTYTGGVTTPPTTPPVTTPPVTTPPVTTPPTTPTGACQTTNTQSGQDYTKTIDSTTIVNNNVWNKDEAGPQKIGICNWNNWYVLSNQPGQGHDDSVKSYPDTQKHVNYPITTLPTITSSWKTGTPAGGGTVPPVKGKQWNASYDLWLGDNANSNYDTEIMIWTNWTANWQYWYGVYGGEKVTIDGVQYAAYHKPGSATDASGVWFVRQGVTNDGSVDITKLLKWADGKGWFKTGSILKEIEYGFEVLYTGEETRFDLLDYSLNLQ